jgi:predicted dehydrogenase
MQDDKKVGIGIIGCGNISTAYLKAAAHFPILDIRAVADRHHPAAEAQGAAFGVPVKSVDDLLAADDIEIVLNLTIPQAHVDVGLAALAAGKHVYSEKPLAVTVADGKRLVAEGEKRGLRVGCAPDTFLGGAHQTCRDIVDSGQLGQIIGGTAFFMCPGHERWHPNPDFYYQTGGGPMLDMGPYYITQLVNLLGPVASVTGMASKLRDTRPITSEPRNGDMIKVEVFTHVTGTLSFASGAIVQVGMSFDVAAHRHTPIEVYGTDATLLVPDPNHFGGQIETRGKNEDWVTAPITMPYWDGNFRSLGLADMAQAIRSDRPHRASGALALHALEVMEAVENAAQSGRRIDITTQPERPAPLGDSIVNAMLAK